MTEPKPVITLRLDDGLVTVVSAESLEVIGKALHSLSGAILYLRPLHWDGEPDEEASVHILHSDRIVRIEVPGQVIEQLGLLPVASDSSEAR